MANVNPFGDTATKTQRIDADPYESESVDVAQNAIQYSDDDVEEVEEEVEVPDSESEEDIAAPSSVGGATPGSSSGAKAVPGRVEPTEEVKAVKHRVPASAPPAKPKLSHTRNPFESPGSWTEADFREVTVIVPPLTSKAETTNAKTRENKPEGRFWRADIKFSYGPFMQKQIRISGVAVPYVEQKEYGTDTGYAYLCLPGFIGPHIAEAGRSLRPTTTKIGRLVSDTERYWVRANNIAGKFGVLDKRTNKFRKMSLETLFGGTGKGLIVNCVLEFRVKASTDDMKPLTPNVPQRIDVELIQAFIAKTNVDVQPPRMDATVDSRKPAQVAATPEDYATDDVMKTLANLGLA